MAKQVFTFERRKRKKRKGIHSKNNKPSKKYIGQGR
jgi:hypothetical protein|tara:strand:- start:167 stop:274 length:108 start_codon:yes stop_codon:yes gene_type:complete